MGTDIKSYYFIGSPVSGTEIANIYSANALQGELLRVSIKSNHANGSLFLFESGTNQLLFYQNLASGTNYITKLPRFNQHDVSGVALPATSGNVFGTYPLNAPVYIAGSAMTSGTSQRVVMEVYYR